MPKNLNGGNKAKKGKNSRFRVEKKLDYATDGQYYGVCTKYYGSARGDVTYIMNSDKSGNESELSALGIIRGSIKKRTRLRAGDIVVVSPREFQSDKVDIVVVYNQDDYHKLKRTNCVHSKIIAMRENLSNAENENKNESSVSFDLDDEYNDDMFDGKKGKKKLGNSESYQDIYNGLPSINDESDEDSNDEIDNI